MKQGGSGGLGVWLPDKIQIVKFEFQMKSNTF